MWSGDLAVAMRDRSGTGASGYPSGSNTRRPEREATTMSHDPCTPSQADDDRQQVAFHLAAISQTVQDLKDDVVLARLAVDMSDDLDASLAVLEREIAVSRVTIVRSAQILHHLEALARLARGTD
jgi:hypothetical protein